MSSSAMKEKLVQYFNEALAMENAAADRVQSRMNATPVEETKQQLQYHLEQTFQQQERLRNIITKQGGSPTTMKATLPNLSDRAICRLRYKWGFTNPEIVEILEIKPETLKSRLNDKILPAIRRILLTTLPPEMAKDLSTLRKKPGRDS